MEIRKGLKPYVSFWDNSKQIDQSTWDPYTHWCVVLYEYDENAEKIWKGFVTYANCYGIRPVGLMSTLVIPFRGSAELSRFKPFYVLGLRAPFPTVYVERVEERMAAILNKSELALEPEDELNSAFALMLAATGHKGFDRQREMWEKERFLARFESVNERDIVELFKFNGVKDVKALCEIPGTILDRRRFYELYPERPPPKYFFRVPLVEAPTFAALPLYEGGLVHLSFLDVGEWLWHRSVERMRRLRTRYWLEPPEQLKEVLDLLEMPRHSSKHVEGANVDIEDLVRMMPPCIRSSVVGRFPPDPIRWHLTSVCARSGVSVVSLGALLDDLNERFPKKRPLNTKARFDYEHCYDKGYAPPKCDSLPACMKCPFNGDKGKCLEQFKREWPQHSRFSTLKHFYGPNFWSREVLYHQKKFIQ